MRLAGCACAVQVKREAGRTRIAQSGSLLKARDQIVAAVLPPIGNGRGGRDRPHSLAQVLGDGLEGGLIETIDTIDDERRQHVALRIVEDSALLQTLKSTTPCGLNPVRRYYPMWL